MNAQHTPGPWWTRAKYSEEEMGVAIIAASTDCGPLPGNPTRGMVAWASELLPENAALCEANARLIAAAPELLEALEAARDGMEASGGWDGDDQIFEMIVAAIAKARNP